jgi:oligoendopeptidase F
MVKELGAKKIRWDLSDLFSGLDDPQINEIIDSTQKKAKEFSEKYKTKLVSLTAADLKIAYLGFESLLKPLYRLSQYMSLRYSTDAANNKIKALLAQVDEIESRVQNELVFFELELAKISQEKYLVLKADPELKEFSYSLEMTKKTARYNLSEEEEKIINLKDLTGTEAHRKLYNELTSAFQFEFEIDGKLKKMTGSELRSLRLHPDAKVRRAAMKLFFSHYEENGPIITHLFNNIVKDFAIEKDLRGYKSAISIRNVSQDLEDTAVEVLHDVTTKSAGLVNRYYKIKAKLLDLPDLGLADIYAPIPKSTKVFTFAESKEIVLDGFKAFDKSFFNMANAMFLENRIDAPVQKGKRGGAFCSSSIPELKPYVLLNFLGKQRDVATMAHELGHAIHDMLCSKQNLFNYHPILPFAETASIFSEMIITDLLLKKETDKQTKIALITDKLEDIFASSHRQNMFSRFEIQAHKNINNQIMSSEELCELYQNELKAMFGDAVKYSPEYCWEWSSIPHIFEWPFYVYAYNFANLFVIALYQKYLEEGAAFVPKFKEFLALGSSLSPKEIADIVGIDFTCSSFWQKSLTYIENMISTLEELV